MPRRRVAHLGSHVHHRRARNKRRYTRLRFITIFEVSPRQLGHWNADRAVLWHVSHQVVLWRRIKGSPSIQKPEKVLLMRTYLGTTYCRKNIVIRPPTLVKPPRGQKPFHSVLLFHHEFFWFPLRKKYARMWEAEKKLYAMDKYVVNSCNRENVLHRV